MNTSEKATLVTVVLLLIIVLAAISNGIYCIVNYWSTPTLEIPYHCKH